MESQLPESSFQTVSFSSYLRTVYKSTLFERVGLIRAGVPCGYFYDTAQAMGVSLADLAKSLGVPLSLVYSVKSKGSLSQKKSLSNQIIGIHLLIGQVQNLVEECSDPDGFDAADGLENGLLVQTMRLVVNARQNTSTLSLVKGLRRIC